MSQLVQLLDPKERVSPVRKREPGPRPDWLRVTYRRNDRFAEVQALKDGLSLVTVCEEARCPNIDECWSAGTATFMLMGDVCTRHCGFCAVGKGKPGALDPEEPHRTAQAISTLGVQYAVITSVNRDDLADGGAHHFAETVKAVRSTSPETRVELLIPDFRGDRGALETVLASMPDVVGHNTETVPRLYRKVRFQADYQQSLDVLAAISAWDGVKSKTGLMLGLGETDAEVEEVMWDLRDHGVQILSLGQYLAPTGKHMPVDRWVEPDTFDRLAEVGLSMGFEYVESGPLVRSSYMAHRPFVSEPGGTQ